MSRAREQLYSRISDHLAIIYKEILEDEQLALLSDELIDLMRLQNVTETPEQFVNHWDESDIVMITYGNTILEPDKTPLQSLLDFLDNFTDDCISSVHILPFFPYSSDDGFAIIDYSTVNSGLGDWNDIQNIAAKYRLMSDVVINHCSSRSYWFENFLRQEDPGKDYFFCSDPRKDHSQVTRPRTNPLLQVVETTDGTRYVWSTFSFDQVDFDFRNPEVLKQFIKLFRLYLDMGVRIFRLDAIAFLWKKQGTNCLNLLETHETVRLIRTLVEHAQTDAVIITETNIPNRENLTYFGNNNEAHWIYNFSLPPLLVHALVSGNSHYLKQWLMSMPPAHNGTGYFNFIASHDGIGLRPVEGVLDNDEEKQLIEVMQSFGGYVSWRALDNGQNKPYEINISLYDALKGTIDGEDDFNLQRFICAHAIMLGLEGIPAFYIHSLLGTQNDYKRVEHTGHNRSINRHQWFYQELSGSLADPNRHHQVCFSEIKRLISIRKKQKAFHPNASQYTLHFDNSLLGFTRESLECQQIIHCISNISNKPINIPVSSINLLATEEWFNLIRNEAIDRLADELIIDPYETLWISNRHS